MVYAPDDSEIYTLNSSAWLILRLCDGRPEPKIAHAFHRAVEPMLTLEEARQEVRTGIEDLIKKRIVEAVNRRGKRKQPAAREMSS